MKYKATIKECSGHNLVKLTVGRRVGTGTDHGTEVHQEIGTIGPMSRDTAEELKRDLECIQELETSSA